MGSICKSWAQTCVKDPSREIPATCSVLLGEDRKDVLGFSCPQGISQPEPSLVQFRSLTLRQQFSKYGDEPISKKEWEMSQFGCFLCTVSWGYNCREYCMPMNHCFFICYSGVGLPVANLTGFQRQILFLWWLG